MKKKLELKLIRPNKSSADFDTWRYSARKLIRHIHEVHSTNQVGRGQRPSEKRREKRREKSREKLRKNVEKKVRTRAKLRRIFEIKSVISWHLMASVG